MTPSKPNVNAKTIREALDSVEVQMYLSGKSITEIMRVTGKNYSRVKAAIDLSGVPIRLIRKSA